MTERPNFEKAEPSGEMQARLNGFTLEETQTYLESLQRLSDEGQDMCSMIQLTQKVLQLKIENNINKHD